MATLKMLIDKMTSRKNFQQDRNSITVESIEIDFPLVFAIEREKLVGSEFVFAFLF